MAKKDDTIKIDNFQVGIGASAYLGFEEIRGLNIKDKPGAIFPDYALVKESSTTVDDLIVSTITDDNGTMYGVANVDGNSIFKRTTGGVWSELSGYGGSGLGGINFWKGYIIVIHLDGKLDASDDDGASWENNFDQVSNLGNDSSPSLVAKDDVLYVGTLNLVDKLAEVDGETFDPTDSDTWEMTRGIVNLGSTYDIRSIVELNDNLMLGTVNSASTTEANVYSWDRSSVGIFEDAIKIKENGVSYMIEVENILYIMAGKRGRWYRSAGVGSQFLSEIPKTMMDITTWELETQYNNAVAYLDGIIYFGVSYVNDKDKLGVYGLNIRTGKMTFAHIISTGETGENDGIKIGSITNVSKSISSVTRDSICVTWLDKKDTDAYGADGQDDTKYTGDKTFLTTQFFTVGTNLRKKGFQEILVNLSKLMVEDDSVKIYYRTVQDGAWTFIRTWDTDGDQNLYTPFGVSGIANIQFKIVLNNKAELLNINIRYISI